MEENVNMTGIELEQCVIDNDELDTISNVREVLVWDLDRDKDTLSDYIIDNCNCIELPDGIDNPLEYIEKDMDSQPNDDNFDKILLEGEYTQDLINKKDILQKELNGIDRQLLYSGEKQIDYIFPPYVVDDKIDNLTQVCGDYLTTETIMPSAMSYEDWLIKTYNTEDSKVLYDKYLMEIRKELREWWFKRNPGANRDRSTPIISPDPNYPNWQLTKENPTIEE